MDELIIGEQKYLSSKRAAEITGYAKDYIGQLCREGRVEARLVGRSWYVREAAIRDHRFGAENAPTEQERDTIVESIDKNWEAPKYAKIEQQTVHTENDVTADAITTIVEEAGSKEAKINEIIEPRVNEMPDLAQKMQDAWQSWFDKPINFNTSEAIGEQNEGVSHQEREERADSEDFNDESPVSIHKIDDLQGDSGMVEPHEDNEPDISVPIDQIQEIGPVTGVLDEEIPRQGAYRKTRSYLLLRMVLIGAAALILLFTLVAIGVTDSLNIGGFDYFSAVAGSKSNVRYDGG